MINNQKSHIIRIFVFGTLLKGARLDYYMGGSVYQGSFYTQGQLMMAENGSVYIDFKAKDTFTRGEVYLVDYNCLRRINHLETASGEFPKGYDLDMIPVWDLEKNPDYNFNQENSMPAFFYRRRNEPRKITSGYYGNFREPIFVLGDFLKKENEKELNENDVIEFMQPVMKTLE